MEMNPKYAEAYTKMLEKLSEAFNPMKEAFAAVMIPVYKFVTAIAELIIKFNEAHPVLAKFIQGTMMLVPALTLILAPLAVGIGLLKGYRSDLIFSLANGETIGFRVNGRQPCSLGCSRRNCWISSRVYVCI
ncbi:hypothetical protein AAHH76_30095 [Bacillus toyonensis]